MINKLVRTLCPDSPALHLRRGTVVKEDPAGYYVQYDQDGLAFGPFSKDSLVEVEESARAPNESQTDYLLREFAPDFTCWTEAALKVFDNVQKQKRNEYERLRKKHNRRA